MAKSGKIRGITIELGADTSQFQKAMSNLDKTLKNTQNQLKDVNKLLKLDPTNTDLLKQKQELLNTSIKNTQDRLKTLKDAYKQLDGQDTEEAKQQQDALTREIAETEQNLKSLKEQYRDFGSVAKQQLTAVGDKMQEIGGKITDVGKGLTTKVTLPLVGLFTAGVSSASDYEENLNKLDVAFGEYADDVREFTDNAQLNYGLSKKDASQIASSFGAMAKGIGFAEGEASEMAVTLTGLSSDLASYFNTDIESAGNSLEAIFTGNAQALKQYGVVMTDVNLKEYAESIGMTAKEYSNLGAQDKAMLRFNYVMSQTADAQGDFERTSDGTANSIKSFQASVQDLMTVIGEQLLPIITPIIQKITEVISNLSNLDEGTMETIVKIGLVVAAIGPVLTVLGTLITTIGSVIKIVGLIATPVGAIVTLIALVIAWVTKMYMTNEDFRNEVNRLASSVKEKFIAIKDGVVNAMTTARDFVKNAIEKIKSFFKFEWSLPKLKLPHVSISGEFSLMPPRVPKFSIDWYSKAMKNGMILNNPTIFGMMNGKYLGGGEAGSETIVGTNSLMNMIAKASKGTTINMTVVAKDQNVNQLADIVVDKITRQIQRERLVY